jgi:hypothetical protein
VDGTFHDLERDATMVQLQRQLVIGGGENAAHAKARQHEFSHLGGVGASILRCQRLSSTLIRPEAVVNLDLSIRHAAAYFYLK